MRAILSLSNKAGLDRLGQGLAGLGIEIYATGGTYSVLQAAGVAVRPVSDLTGFPEILEGRVKSLHPAVYGGILARRDVPADLKELAAHGLLTIDLVAVNLYPFAETVARLSADPLPAGDEAEAAAGLDRALEQIDIGGPALLRAAAKNFPAVLPLCDPADYEEVLAALGRPAGPDAAFRRRLAARAFRHVAVYDAFIAAYLGNADPGAADPGAEEGWPGELPLGLHKVQDLRYGENPQQRAALYCLPWPGSGPSLSGLVGAQQVQGKPLSYNNIIDGDAAWAVTRDLAPAAAGNLRSAAVAIVKHGNPCGLGWAADPLLAYELALAGDPLAAFGGIVAANVPVTGPLARRLAARFYEMVLAPGFDEEARQVLSARPNLRLLVLPFDGSEAPPALAWRSVSGGLLVQEVDRLDEAEVSQGRVVTRRAPGEQEWATLAFAWRAVRHVKSNAIVLARPEAAGAASSFGAASSAGAMAVVGVGAGQPSRVAAVEIAIQRAGPRSVGAVLASDAFFPKADGVEAAVRAGVQAIVQPGGSQGDQEVIAAADAAGLAMVLTGTRHFLH